MTGLNDPLGADAGRLEQPGVLAADLRGGAVRDVGLLDEIADLGMPVRGEAMAARQHGDHLVAVQGDVAQARVAGAFRHDHQIDRALLQGGDRVERHVRRDLEVDLGVGGLEGAHQPGQPTVPAQRGTAQPHRYALHGVGHPGIRLGAFELGQDAERGHRQTTARLGEGGRGVLPVDQPATHPPFGLLEPVRERRRCQVERDGGIRERAGSGDGTQGGEVAEVESGHIEKNSI